MLQGISNYNFGRLQFGSNILVTLLRRGFQREKEGREGGRGGEREGKEKGKGR